MRIIRIAFATLLFLALPLASFAQEGEGKGPKTLAVQNRQHTMAHEFSAWLGTLPLDAFEKGLTFTGAYTLHFNDLFAWEIGQFTYSYLIETDLNDELANLPQPVGHTEIEPVEYFVTSSFVFKPIYGKLALLNRTLVFGEVFALIGGGYGKMRLTDRAVVDGGVGFRIYAGKYVSFRLDIRDYMFLLKDDLHNELWIALGVCLSFG
jgi:outer membrane beta-barrel protein